MNLLFVSLAFLILFLTVEVLNKKIGLKSEYTRKIAHLLSGVIVFFLPYFLTAYQIISLAALFTILLIGTRYFGLLSSIHKVNRKTIGEVYFPLGLGLSAFFFLPQNILAFQFGVLVLAFSDAFGGLVGQLYGKHKIGFGLSKSWEGTLVFFLTTLVAFLLLVFPSAGKPILFGVLISAIITIVEGLLSAGLDNLVLPLASAFLLNLFIRM